MSKAQSVPAPVSAPVSAPVTFRDAAWKFRTLILPDGCAVPVVDYCVTTEDPAVIEYLTSHSDFSRV